MSETSSIAVLLFELSGHRYGLPVDDTDEVVQSVAVTPLPKAPDIIEGAINFRGAIIPVLDIRRRFGLPFRPVSLDDHLIIARADVRPVAIRVDRANELIDIPRDDIAPANTVSNRADYIAGIAKLPDGLVIIHDLKVFLSAAENEALDSALRDESSERTHPSL